MSVVEMFSPGFDDFLLAERGLTQISGVSPYGEGLRWELFNDPAVDLTSGLGEVTGRVMVGSCGGILTHALVLVFAQIGKSQLICLPLGA